MFFRREKPAVHTFDSRLGDLRGKGFSVAPKGAGTAVALRDGCAAVLKDAGATVEIEKTGVLIGNAIGVLTHGGYQVYFETSAGERRAGTAAQLKALHAFDEDLREALGLTSLYNEGLGTTNGRHLYDRVRDRDQGKKPVFSVR
ncbi:MAG: hypothetical protein K2X03_22410 [Bryobacteraceae bacterium]|nr:hypothetical protein [Bryobacteraceae bacterium]